MGSDLGASAEFGIPTGTGGGYLHISQVLHFRWRFGQHIQTERWMDRHTRVDD